MCDVELLPRHLAAKSISPSEIVLPHNEVIQAIECLTARGYIVFAWEGWIKYPDGTCGHSSQHQGTREFWGTKGQTAEERIQETAVFMQQTIEGSQLKWNEKPEIQGATLYFCLSVKSA